MVVTSCLDDSRFSTLYSCVRVIWKWLLMIISFSTQEAFCYSHIYSNMSMMSLLLQYWNECGICWIIMSDKHKHYSLYERLMTGLHNKSTSEDENARDSREICQRIINFFIQQITVPFLFSLYFLYQHLHQREWWEEKHILLKYVISLSGPLM